MNILKELLSIKESRTSNKKVVIYMLLAYSFSIVIKLILYYQISNNINYFYNGNIIPLWTPDAGLYGFYANNLLNGTNYPFISEYIPAYLIYLIVNISGLSVNSVLFFAPIFFSSLIVIPIILIANNYNIVKVGLYSALFGSIMSSYYYRTHLGYYDTDMLNVVLPLFAIYFLIKLVESNKILYALYGSFALILFNLWYHSSSAIILSIIITFTLYTLIFKRKSRTLYQGITLLVISIFPIYILYKIILIIVLPIIFLYINRYRKIDYRYYIGIFTILAISMLYFSDISKSYNRASNYLVKDNLIEIKSNNSENIRFLGDLSIVSEARGINFDMLSYRVLGNKVLFIISILGYLALILRYNSMLLTLPLVFLTLLSMSAGLRFTIYGVAIFSLSLLYAIELIFKTILNKIGNFSQKISDIAVTIFILFIILFSITNILKYNRYINPFYFSCRDDIKALDILKSSSSNKDFIIAPWDYGWPLWYYSNISTIVDNGKHGEDNFITSKILLSDNQTFVKNASIFFVNRYKRDSLSKIMTQFLNDYSIEYLKKLEDINYSLPKSNRDVYILLHKSMLFTTYNSIEDASNINLKTGKNYPSNLYNRLSLLEDYNKTLNILKTNSRFSIDIEHGRIVSTDSKENADIREISIVKGSNIELHKNYNSPNNIYIVVYNKIVLIMNKKLYNSFLIQALLFNNYNRDYFTKVARTKNLLILKVNGK